jgi:hypothetical protein
VIAREIPGRSITAKTGSWANKGSWRFSKYFPLEKQMKWFAHEQSFIGLVDLPPGISEDKVLDKARHLRRSLGASEPSRMRGRSA